MAEYPDTSSNLASRVAPIIEDREANVEEAIPHNHHDDAQQFVDVIMQGHHDRLDGIYGPTYREIVERENAFVSRVRSGDGTASNPHRIWFSEFQVTPDWNVTAE